MRWPWQKKEPETIYGKMVQWEQRPIALEKYVPMQDLSKEEPGLREYQVLTGKRVEKAADTDRLDGAILAYFYREEDSPAKINHFFKTHKALQVVDHYHQWMYRQEEAGDLPYLGLSTYLMQNSKEVEAVKFGMLLAPYYDLMGAKGALKTLVLLGSWPDFTYYAIRALKDLPQGSYYIAQMNEHTFGYGKMCIAEYLKEKGVLQ